MKMKEYREYKKAWNAFMEKYNSLKGEEQYVEEDDEEEGEGVVFDPRRYVPYSPQKDYSSFLPEWAKALSNEEQRAVAWLASQLPTYRHDIFSPHYSDNPFNRKMIVRHAVEVFNAVKEAYQSLP